jgi:ATP synthase protein I
LPGPAACGDACRRAVERFHPMDDDRKTSSRDLKDLGERIDRAQASIEEKDRRKYGRGSAYSFGVRVATDLVAAVVVGFLIGWLLDRFLGTSPWMLLLFVLLGMAAGILNVMRAAKSLEARRHLEETAAPPNAPKVVDDDD